MIRRILTKTTGDWDLVEVENGKTYKITGMRRAAIGSTLDNDLQDAMILSDLIDGDRSVADKELPKIEEIVWNQLRRAYLARADNDDEFALSPDEVKTLTRWTKPRLA